MRSSPSPPGWRHEARFGRPSAGLAVAALGAAIFLAGTPAREGLRSATRPSLIDRIPTAVDPATLPEITVTADVVDFDHELAGTGMAEVVVTLARNLELENHALLNRDDAVLVAVDHGDRLDEMRSRLEEADANGTTVVAHYAFEAIDVSLIEPFGAQTGLSLGLRGTGTMTEETHDRSGMVVSRESAPFDLTFAMRRATGARWMNVAVLPDAP